MNSNYRNTLIYIIGAFASFLADIFQFFFFQTLYLYIVVSLYVAILFSRKQKKLLSILALFIMLESFCFYSQPGYALYILLPVTAGALITQKLLFSNRAQPILWLIICLLIDIYVIQWFLLGSSPKNIYTIMKIGGNIILMSYFSLKVNFGSNQGDRS